MHRSRVGSVLIALGFLLVAPAAASAVGPVCAEPDATGVTVCTFAYTGAMEAWTVPAGVGSVTFDLWGAEGGRGASAAGKGAHVTGTMPVKPGQTLELRIGGKGGAGSFGGGAPGFNGGGSGTLGFRAGGGGGGATDVRPVAGTLASRLLVAGAGGGSGHDIVQAPVNVGGNSGSAGGDAGDKSQATGGKGGGPGTSSAGGAGGAAGQKGPDCTSYSGGPAGQDGTAGTGGANGGAGGTEGGGGGGGGWFGGGGGGSGMACATYVQTSGGGGGGGGSSHAAVGVTNVAIVEGARAGNGLITVSYRLPGSECSAPDAQNVVTCTYDYTGGPQFWIIPEGVDSATFDVWGAAGGKGAFAPAGTLAGKGGHVSGTAPIVDGAGVTMTLIVGGKGGSDGTGGFGGGGDAGSNLGAGGGGGASNAYVELPGVPDPLIYEFFVAGGGGGSGDSSGGSGAPGNGGNSGSPGTAGGNQGPAGGGGGGGAGSATVGGAGGLAGVPTGSCSEPSGGSAGTAGESLLGGHGGSGQLVNAGGGGGGGLFGGGAGGAAYRCGIVYHAGGGGGGGGSSLIGAATTNELIEEGVSTGNGHIVITYTVPVVDETSPVIVPHYDGTLGDNGWWTGPVTITWSVSDPESGIESTSGCGPTTLTEDTSGTSVECSASNGTLSTIVLLTIRIDQTAPDLAPTVTPDPVDAGEVATADPHATDAGSGIASASCDSPDTSVAGPAQVTCTATDEAGNIGSATADYTVTDPSSPQIDHVITGTLGNDGWYTSDVTITFTVSDPESPFTTTCTDQTFTADTADVAVNCSATSAGGLTLFQAHFKIDQTAPVLAPTVVPNPVLIGGAAVADPHASDAMSGISSSSCAAPATATAGVKSLVCTAEDNAGNTSSASVGYTVAYRFLGFQRPTTGAVVKAGATVTIAFAVGTSSGDRLTDLQASALAAGCQVRVSFTGGNPNPDCATYNPTNDTFGFTLKTQKGLSGNQTITVQVFVGTDVVTTGSVVVKVKP